MPRSKKIEVVLSLETKQAIQQLAIFNKKAKQSFAGMAKTSKKSSQAILGNFKLMATAIAGLGIGKLVKGIVNVSVEFDRWNRTLKAVTQGVESFDDAQKFLRKTSEDLGLVYINQIKSYSQMIAATKDSGISLEEMKEVYLSISQASTVYQLSVEDNWQAMRALIQMFNKGTISAEELRGQLGERIPGALDTMAKSISVNKTELLKMMEEGKLLASEVLPLFAKAIKEEMADKLPTATQSARAEINRLKTAWMDFQNAIGEGSDEVPGVLAIVIEIVKKIKETLKDETFVKDFTLAFGEFAKTLKGIVDALLPKLPAILKTVSTIMKLIAAYMPEIIAGLTILLGLKMAKYWMGFAKGIVGAWMGLSNINTKVTETTTILKGLSGTKGGIGGIIKSLKKSTGGFKMFRNALIMIGKPLAFIGAKFPILQKAIGFLFVWIGRLVPLLFIILIPLIKAALILGAVSLAVWLLYKGIKVVFPEMGKIIDDWAKPIIEKLKAVWTWMKNIMGIAGKTVETIENVTGTTKKPEEKFVKNPELFQKAYASVQQYEKDLKELKREEIKFYKGAIDIELLDLKDAYQEKLKLFEKHAKDKDRITKLYKDKIDKMFVSSANDMITIQNDLDKKIHTLRGDDFKTREIENKEVLDNIKLQVDEAISNFKRMEEEGGVPLAGSTDMIKQLLDTYNKLKEETDKQLKIDIENEALEKMKEDIEEINTLFADNITDGFMAMIDGSKTASEAFKDMATSILQDLARMMIKQAIFNALQAASSSSSWYGTIAGAILGSAKGNVFSNGNLVPFANGGIVNGPTMFPMANGMGLIGEKGPEGVLPMDRMADGKLGVNASGLGGSGMSVVNTINFNGDVGSKEDQERTAALLTGQIDDKIRMAIANEKRYGGQLNNNGMNWRTF